MKNPIKTERVKYLNGRALYVAKLGAVEESGDTKEAAEALLLKSLDAMSIKQIAVRALNDGRVAVMQIMGANPDGSLSVMFTRYRADGRSDGSVMYGARYFREAEEKFECELRGCGQLDTPAVA